MSDSPGISVYEERIDGFLERIEAQFSKFGDTIAFARSASENAAAALAAAQSNGNEIAGLRREFKTFEGRLSAIEARDDALVSLISEVRDELKGASEAVKFVKELRAGFSVIYNRSTSPEERAAQSQANVARVSALRGSDE